MTMRDTGRRIAESARNLLARVSFRRSRKPSALREDARLAFEKGEPAAGLAKLLELGDAAEPADLHKIAECYEYGAGALQNFVSAAEWYKRAADKGHLESIVRLGDIYMVGRVVPSRSGDGAEAPQSRLLPKGTSVRQDFSEAFRWNKLAASKGAAAAQAMLGYQYAAALGTERNYAEALKAFSEAAAQDNASGHFGLGTLYAGTALGQPDFGKAAEHFEKAAAQNHAGAKLSLSHLLLAGQGVEADPGRAAKLLQEAAEANQDEAMYRLGDFIRPVRASNGIWRWQRPG